MGSINTMYLSPPEVKFLLMHEDFTADEADVFCAFDLQENLGDSGSYRLERDNPRGGDDLGLFSLNTKAQVVHLSADRYAAFDVIWNIRKTRLIYLASGFGPWNYGPNAYGPRLNPPRPARTDASINLAAVKAMVANPVNPYHRMVRAGVPTYDLPIPPLGEYISRLPTSDLKYGDILGAAGKKGDDLTQLQRLLDEMGRWGRPGQYDRSYFNTVAGLGTHAGKGISSIQVDLTTAGFWTGPTDGKRYDAALRKAWDGVMIADMKGLRI